MQAGLVLYVVRYEECVEFYRDVLALPVLFATATLTCFAWGESSLMVEREDDPELIASRPASRTCLRFLVEDVAASAEALRAREIEIDYQVHAWGEVAKFHDPDGNLCAFKDLAGFERQCEFALG